MATVLAQPKWIGKSMSIWGAAMAFAAVAYQTVGPILDAVGVTIPVTPEDIANVSEVGTKALTLAAGVVGLVTTIIGRIRAGKNVQPVTILPNAPSTIVTVAVPPATGKASG